MSFIVARSLANIATPLTLNLGLEDQVVECIKVVENAVYLSENMLLACPCMKAYLLGISERIIPSIHASCSSGSPWPM